jgi:hypothetical protein
MSTKRKTDTKYQERKWRRRIAGTLCAVASLSTYESEAQAQDAMRDKVAVRISRLPTAARENAERLAAANPNHFYLNAADNTPGSARAGFVSGTDLLSASCHAAADAVDPLALSGAWFLTAVRCFLGENSSLMTSGRGTIQPETVHLLWNAPGWLPGQMLVATQQRHQGMDVLGGDMKFQFKGRALVDAVGNAFDLYSIPAPTMSAEGRAREASQRHARNLLVKARYYDPNIESYVLRLADESSAVEIREDTLDILPDRFSHPATWDTTQQVTARTWPADTTDPNGGFDPAAQYPSCQGCSSLFYPSPHPAAGCLSNDLTLPSASGQLGPTTATCGDAVGASCFSPFMGNCLYTLSRKNYPADYPELRTLTSGNFVTDPGTVKQDLTACQSYTWAPEASNLPYATGYVAFTELANYKNHWSSYFNPYPQPRKQKVTAVVQTSDAGPGAWGLYQAEPDPGLLRRIRVGPGPGPHGGTHMGIVAHEYHHYIQDALGGIPTTPAVKEGWAQSGVLRYIIYNVVSTGIWGSTQYWNNAPIGSVRHRERIQNGERIPDAITKDAQADLFFPSPSCQLVNGVPIDSYRCGAVIGATYWELAWNFCRTGSGSCANNEKILTQGAYGDSGWILANSAFAYAAGHVSSLSTVDIFMDQVHQAYYDFKQAGYSDLASYNRIYSVLAHHCVGWYESCSTGHKFPMSPLPSTQTHRVNLLEGEARSGGGTVVSDVTASTGTTLKLTSSSGIATWSLNPLQGFATTRGLRLAIRRETSSTPSLKFSVNGGAWTTANLTGIETSNYKWLEIGQASWLSGQNYIDLWILGGTGALLVDAVLVAPDYQQRWCACPVGAPYTIAPDGESSVGTTVAGCEN